MHMFRSEPDFEAFERVIVETYERQPIRILSYCVLLNHWHFVVWPEEDGHWTEPSVPSAGDGMRASE
jgi:putative transposase